MMKITNTKSLNTALLSICHNNRNRPTLLIPCKKTLFLRLTPYVKNRESIAKLRPEEPILWF